VRSDSGGLELRVKRQPFGFQRVFLGLQLALPLADARRIAAGSVKGRIRQLPLARAALFAYSVQLRFKFLQALP
jgi:hypothetical protein